MKPEIRMLEKAILAGKSMKMSFAQNFTGKLWQEFMPLRSLIKETAGPELYSVEIYPDQDFFNRFDAGRSFTKWAAVRVNEQAELPAGLQELIVPSGKYAVFLYRGKSSEAAPFYQSIFTDWLPAAGYRLDHRPHLAVMGAKYKNNDSESEEEIWIPVL